MRYHQQSDPHLLRVAPASHVLLVHGSSRYFGIPFNICQQEVFIERMDVTHLVRSKPPIPSSSIGLGGSSAAGRVGRVGLATGDLLRAGGGGLLLGGSRFPSPPFDGLRSRCEGLSGVLPMSAYFQNGAGELVGMC